MPAKPSVIDPTRETEPPSSADSSLERMKRPPLSPEERRAADAHTIAVLERHGIPFRPSMETALMVLDGGDMIHLDQTLQRWSFAKVGRARAAAAAIMLDAFAQAKGENLRRNLRMFTFRPPLKKAAPGDLAEELANFSRRYDRVIGRLVGKGLIRPVLSVVQIRYAVDLDCWDLHAHCMWDIDSKDVDKVFMEIGRKFSDPWKERKNIEKPGALANYIFCGAVDYREIVNWPDKAVKQRAKLSRFRG